MTNAIIIGGEHVALKTPVRTWHAHKLELKPGLGARKRTKTIDLVVLHVTGAEHPPDKMFHNLLKRKNADGKPMPLGVEFAIDYDGMIWQFCDPLLVDSFDAGFVNDRSIGIEIINYGFTRNPQLEKQWAPLRTHYDTNIHGRNYRMARSNNAQHAAMLELVDALTDHPKLSVPRCIPRTSTGAIRTTVMTGAEVKAYRGVIPHYAIDAAKIDPGTDVLQTLDYVGYK